jgi:hypothetical protein
MVVLYQISGQLRKGVFGALCLVPCALCFVRREAWKTLVLQGFGEVEAAGEAVTRDA